MLSDESRLGPDAAAARPKSDRSVAALLSDLASETATLVRQEIALFKAELREKLARVGQGVGAMMNMVTKFELSDAPAGTNMHWSAEVRIAGPVGSMGQRVLQPIVNQQVQHVLGALDQQVQAARDGAPGTGD